MQKRKAKQSRRYCRRSKSGFLLPFFAVSLIAIMGGMAFCIDVARDFQVLSELDYAARSAALYAYPYATDRFGAFDLSTAQNNISQRILANGQQGWNHALKGQQGTTSVTDQPVTFGETDISFVNNPNPQDSSEMLLRVTAERTGNDGITQVFMPMLFSNFNKTAPSSVRTMPTHRTVEVIGQPATRVGQGAPLQSPAGTRAFDFMGFAALPIALSNVEFAGFAKSGTKTPLTVTLTNSSQSGQTNSTTTGTIKGALINLASSGSSTSFYGTAQGDRDIDQLLGQLGYFGGQTSQAPVAPSVVELGSQVNAFDPTDKAYISRQGEISKALTQMAANQNVNQFYMVPVIYTDPLYGTSNKIAGFARAQISINKTANVQNGVVTSLTLTLGESLPMRNTSAVTGYLTTTAETGQTPMPAPPAPFTPRLYDPNSGGISSRPRGIVLAPTISPRQVSAI